MPAATPSSPLAGEELAATDHGSRGWLALWILAAILAVEAGLLGWFFVGGWLGELDGKRWSAFAAIMVLGGLQSHIRRHRDAYRAVRVSWPLVAGQIAAFAGVFAYVDWLAAGAAGTRLGAAGELMVGATLTAAWMLLSVALIAPGLPLARQVLVTMLAFGGFALAAWQVGTLTTSFWKLSGGTTVRLVELMLQPLAGGPVERPAPFVIGTHDFRVAISEPCCGFHGIGLITVLLAGYLWWFRRFHRFPQSLLLLPIGVGLMWLANAVRITALILVGIWISPEIAVHGFHSVAGWIAFLVVGLGIILAAARMPFFTRSALLSADEAAIAPRPASVEATLAPAATSASVSERPTATTCLIPFLALTATTLLTQAFTSGFEVFYPARVLVVAAVLWQLRRDVPWRECRIAPLAVAIGVAAFALWMLLAPPGAVVEASRDPTPLGQPWSALWLVFRVAGSTVTVPIAEEWFFRGFVIRRCIGDDADAVPIGTFSWFSFLLSSVAFGLLHGDAWIAGTVAGMLFALALYTRRRLGDAVVAHATTNALLSGYVIATGSWSRWG